MSSNPIQSFDDGTFTLNPPATSHLVSADGKKVTITALPKTDWWRLPPPDSIDSRTGAFFSRTIDATRNFSAGVWIRGEWGVQFDQGCLMLLAGNTEDVKGDWIKVGVEVETGREYTGGVVTSPWSDWAISPAEHSTSTLNGGSGYALYMQIVREGPLISVSQHFAPYSSDMEAKPAPGDLVKIREVRAFNVDEDGKPKAGEGQEWRVGVMVCGPTNTEGTVGEFENFSFEYL
ncbi:hypothetical protein FB45DRAFT_391396 [Roridomyces roridus]|uniref:Uncharacterized protein n=1 Tax=Roridomyces roridus TaxID=1738132 RepID=A0AAD7B1J7_9AGAR|nr:hypothetical protein FB45DRAFT_391396 [Roridomyces roridus]